MCVLKDYIASHPQTLSDIIAYNEETICISLFLILAVSCILLVNNTENQLEANIPIFMGSLFFIWAVCTSHSLKNKIEFRKTVLDIEKIKTSYINHIKEKEAVLYNENMQFLNEYVKTLKKDKKFELKKNKIIKL